MSFAQVHWIAKYLQRGDNNLHSHSYSQLLLCLGGEGALRIGDSLYPARRGSIYLAHSNIPHCVLSGGETPAPAPKLIDVKYSITDDSYAEIERLLPPVFVPDNFEFYHHRLEGLLNEAQFQEAFYRETINLSFSSLLILFYRSQQKEKSTATLQYEKALSMNEMDPVSDRSGNEIKIDIAHLLKYINQSYNQIISLSDLANLIHVNKNTVIDIFKEVYGMTPIKYINELRMQKAKELLIDSDISVSEISEMVGFQSIHYFSRAFKEKEGRSPLAFRHEQKGSCYVSIDNKIPSNRYK